MPQGPAFIRCLSKIYPGPTNNTSHIFEFICCLLISLVSPHGAEANYWYCFLLKTWPQIVWASDIGCCWSGTVAVMICAGCYIVDKQHTADNCNTVHTFYSYPRTSVCSMLMAMSFTEYHTALYTPSLAERGNFPWLPLDVEWFL